jgi:hypothetical protein
MKSTTHIDEFYERKILPVIITSGSPLSAVEADDCDDWVWSDSKGCGIGWGGKNGGEINGPAG